MNFWPEYIKLKTAIGGGYDMVVANIVSDVIIGLAPHVRPYLKDGGKFLCSGIIDTRAEEVKGKDLSCLKGVFSGGIATIQCMYAPEFTAHSTAETVRVILDGGELEIDWTNRQQVRMTGPAQKVFEGEFTQVL